MIENDDQLGLVVGVGASAGSLESLEKVFAKVDEYDGHAYVVVVHLAPDVKSFLNAILGRFTSMRVVNVSEGMLLEPNTIYINAPGKGLSIRDERFVLSDLDRDERGRAIDSFFASLARGFGRRAVGIILSGTGTDGARGIRNIHAAGGITVAESPRSAKFDGMPKNAIASGCIDFVAAKEQIIEILMHQAHQATDQKRGTIGDPDFESILKLLAIRHGVDFTKYKPTTVVRRMERRVKTCGLATLKEYLQRLDEDAEELDTLYSDLLIGVTEFFRDRRTFQVLGKEIEAQIDRLGPSEDLRIWVAGCSTGEEAYSLAIVAHEAFCASNQTIRLKVIATDVDENALIRASRGVYDRTDLRHVSSTRIANYFSKAGPNQMRVTKEIRKRVLFSRHNLVEDPPFANLHVVACRNLMIYLEPHVQEMATNSCHFALRPNGVLVLGSSEMPMHLENEFEILDLPAHLFRKSREAPELVSDAGAVSRHIAQPAIREVREPVDVPSGDRAELLLDAYAGLIKQFVESGVLLDSRKSVLHFFGNARQLLRKDGQISDSFLSLIPLHLKQPLSDALDGAANHRKPILFRGVEFPSQVVDLAIRGLSSEESGECLWLIEFRDLAAAGLTERQASSEDPNREDTSSETTRANIQALEFNIEQLQSTNQDLIASNETLQNVNEQLHGVNEQLVAVNERCREQILEIQKQNKQFVQLAEASEVGAVLLDESLVIIRFTSAAKRYFRLVDHDLGRPLYNFAHSLQIPDLFELMRQVIASQHFITRSCQDDLGNDVFVKMGPYDYETDDGSPRAGVILTMTSSVDDESHSVGWGTEGFGTIDPEAATDAG